MPNPAVTYTFSNGTTSDATQVNQNFTDLINSLTDGTKSLTIDALTCGGTATLNGSVTLGDGSPDDITVNGSLASSIPIKTNNSYNIGAATLGLASVYLGAPSSRSTRLTSNQSIASSFTLVLPVSVGTSGQKMVTDGSGNLSFSNDGPYKIDNYSLAASANAGALTISLKDAAGSDPSSSSPVILINRNATATTGTPTVTTITAAVSTTIPSTATMGHASSVNQALHVYLIMGTANEIAVIGRPIIDEFSLQNATAITTGADDGYTLYATSNHTSKPVRYLGRLIHNGTAGTWTAPVEISLASNYNRVTRSQVRLHTGNGHGSTNTRIRRFTTQVEAIGTAITYADSAGNGGSFTINEDGIYSITYADGSTTTGVRFGISLNSSQLTTDIDTITTADAIDIAGTSGANEIGKSVFVGFLRAGDVIRAHTQNTTTATSVVRFTICKVSN